MTALSLRQGSPEWLEGRRALITATDIPVLLGLSPYRCEADLADEKMGGPGQESTLRMRIGSALEPLIAEEYTRETGRKVKRFRGMVSHPDLPWAAASPDAQVVGKTMGDRRLVEFKWTTSRSRFADGIPQDIEAQVAWQLAVAQYLVADIVVMTADAMTIYEQWFDEDLFANLVTVAEDFRRRLAEGGPFARDAARIRRDYPSDNGETLESDADINEAVRALVDTRASRKRLEENEATLESAIKARMGEYAALRGDGFHITWKRTKDREETDWQNLARGILNTLPETERKALVGLNTTVRPGFRPFRVVVDKETE